MRRRRRRGILEYSITAQKKIDSPNARVAKNSVALTHGRVYAYSIAQFLEDVKVGFDDTFSTDVYNKFGAVRRVNEFSNSLLYQDRNPDSFSNRSLLANALESAVQNDIERNKLQQYKEKNLFVEVFAKLFSKSDHLSVKKLF